MGHSYETVTLTRDVIGILIPAGTKVELPEGAQAAITQALGGSYTVQVEGHLFRIDGKDADSLGKTVTQVPQVPDNASETELEQAVWDALKTCYDPEIPINIVELGLVYGCRVETLDSGQRKASIKMTLTAPGCGMGDVLVNDVKSKVSQLPTIAETDVQLVFDPPWTQDMMSEAARLQTGMF
ncbi:MAG: putative Fe-S cluster assembly protein SufT [Nevskiaceae bacterium]|nr:MAG: putative Fe-S cluster assembly protein SufT [Nevskiaceae bacterium]